MSSLIKCGSCGKKPRVAATKPTTVKLSDTTNGGSGSNSRRASGSGKLGGGPSIFDKLTDPKLYTGAHKHRFDEDGKGRGKAGRTDHNFSEVDVLGRSAAGVVVPVRTSTNGIDGVSATKRLSQDGAAARQSMSRKKTGPSIFDKLTDPNQYTGAHKHRFDGSGRGRGLAGRDGASGISRDDGNVRDIGASGFLRPGF